MSLKVGSLVKVTSPFLSCGLYERNDILTIKSIHRGCVLVNEVDLPIGFDEIVVVTC